MDKSSICTTYERLLYGKSEGAYRPARCEFVAHHSVCGNIPFEKTSAKNKNNFRALI